MKIRIKSPPCLRCVWGQREDDELIYCFRADVCSRIREGRESDQQREKAMANEGLEAGGRNQGAGRGKKAGAGKSGQRNGSIKRG